MGSLHPRLIALVILASSGAAHAGCTADQVQLRGPSGVQQFRVEVADTDAERAQGLMNRPKMASAAGMLFAFDPPKQAVFWMKNTLIPLDMIFADKTGLVTRVHSDAVPLDETAIDGGMDVAFVLEINGGLAARMGIAEGAQLRSPLIAQSFAIWPCSDE
jgi:uncharacterized membrane protein (UPF0127 family)